MKNEPNGDNNKMRKMKQLLLCAALAVSGVAWADSYGYLTVASANGERSYELKSVNKITFDSVNMILWNGETITAELPLASLDRMFFSSTSGITPITHDEATIALRDGVLHITAQPGSRITLYNMKGQLTKQVTASARETQLNLRGLLSNGVYIVRVGNQSRKVMNK